MNCPKCDEVVEPDAQFCGNCGQQLSNGLNKGSNETPVSSNQSVAEPAQVTSSGQASPAPAYALVNPKRQKAESQSMTALLLGILSIPGAIISVIGLVLAVCGLIMATSVRSGVTKKALNNVAISFGVLGVVASLASAVFGYVYTGKQSAAQKDETSASSGSAGSPSGDDTVVEVATNKLVDTPCYRLTMPSTTLGVIDAVAGNCSAQARSDESFELSGTLFAVDAASNTQVNAANLAETAQRIVGRNAGLLLPGYSVTTERAATFAGSPAYIVDAVQTGGRSSVQLAVVLHAVKHGENIFVIGYGADQAGADVLQFEKGWEWK